MSPGSLIAVDNSSMERLKISQASVEINGGCNYTCPMCPQASGREKTFLRKMPLDVFKKTMIELKELGCREVHLQGSGEPLLGRGIYDYVDIANKCGIGFSIVTNGFFLDESTARFLLDNGISNIRVSVVGYDQQTYMTWMNSDSFDRVYRNCEATLEILSRGNYQTKFSSYHLILDRGRIDWEVAQYRANWIDALSMPAEIWMMHNWAGGYNPQDERQKPKKRSCGRPFAPYITIRAGGDKGRHGAVAPCCFVLGQDSRAILGHTDTQSITQILNDTPYKKLKQAHLEENFDAIDYCKDCDQLYDAPESLVWTNIDGKMYGQHKTNQGIDFRKHSGDTP